MIFSDAITGIFSGVVKPILDKWIPDAKDRLDAEQIIMKSLLALDLGQLEVNKVEAAHENIFVAGWRPAIGWICGASYAYSFILQPFLVFGMTAFGHHVEAAQLPHIDIGELSMVLLGMLGLGTMRSFDKMGPKSSKT